MMKKILSLLLTIVMLLSLAACSIDDSDSKKSKKDTDSTKGESSLPEETEPSVPLGNEVGYRCYGADLPVVTPEGVTDATIDPTKTGTVTVINFWGTWCNPCVSELPHFDQIATDYRGEVTVIAIHSYDQREKAVGFISQHYPDSEIIFSQDWAEETQYGDYYYTLGNPGYYPYTLILDEDGIITDTFIGIMSYEQIQEAIEKAQG